MKSASKVESVTLQRVDEGDADFLAEVYASTRAAELAQVEWTGQQKQAFLTMQFHAQRRYYESEYPGADFQIIQADGQPAGRLYVHRRPDEIRIMDLALLPPWRGQGIGTHLLNGILAEGRQSGRRVTIHVEIFNPALQLYERLGFRPVGSTGVYHLLQWTPAAGVARGRTSPHALNQ